jgi:hypothetical protein
MKTSHRFMGGFPDLMIKIPGEELFYVEIKKGKIIKGMMKVETTTLQRETMKRMKNAGIRVCVWIVIEGKPTHKMVAVPSNCTKVGGIEESQLFHRVIGKGWPIKEIIHQFNWEN